MYLRSTSGQVNPIMDQQIHYPHCPNNRYSRIDIKSSPTEHLNPSQLPLITFYPKILMATVYILYMNTVYISICYHHKNTYDQWSLTTVLALVSPMDGYQNDNKIVVTVNCIRETLLFIRQELFMQSINLHPRPNLQIVTGPHAFN